MLHSISWINYLSGILVLTASYYFVIVIRYYSQDIKNWFSRERKSGSQLMHSAFGTTEQVDSPRQFGEAQTLVGTPEASFKKAEELISWIIGAFQDATEKKSNKTELISALSAILINYSDLKDSAIQSGINELITTECKKLGITPLSEDEMMKAWDGRI